MYSGNTLSGDLCFRPVVLQVLIPNHWHPCHLGTHEKANSRSRTSLRSPESETLEWGPLICMEKALQVIPMHNQD